MADEEKSIILSFSAKPETKNNLRQAAERLRLSVSEILRLLINRYMPLMYNDGPEIAVILKIPRTIKDDPQALRNWLNVKSEGIISHFSKKA